MGYECYIFRINELILEINLNTYTHPDDLTMTLSFIVINNILIDIRTV